MEIIDRTFDKKRNTYIYTFLFSWNIHHIEISWNSYRLLQNDSWIIKEIKKWKSLMWGENMHFSLIKAVLKSVYQKIF